ncbi:unnamed protein product [Adineta ricciae]|uniref:Uncharacterized protein n=1 Tax=Adineta ricciae TaxID=249248 RepID=A0A814Q8B4_ADIRI|nr:unnamed protein product [Adineta ricciae]
MSIENNSDRPRINIQVEEKETTEQWISSFDVNAIETMTAKTGNYKPFHVFIEMLENSIKKTSPSVSLDFLASTDLDMIRKKRNEETKRSSTKRYLILIYKTEYDSTNYVLSLRYSDKSVPINPTDRIHQLTIENQLLKSQLCSDTERSDVQLEHLHLSNTFNDHHHLSANNLKEKDEQIDFLRQMVRRNEEALIKARIRLQQTKTIKDARCKTFYDQIDSLKTSERQWKSKVKVLTDEISFLKRNHSLNDSQQHSKGSFRLTSNDQSQRRCVTSCQRLPSAYDSSNRFNPTAYINAKNQKIQQIERQKKRDTRRALSAGRSRSDPDLSDVTLKHANKTKSQKLSRKHSNNCDYDQSNDSFDSDIERLSSPLVLHRPASHNSTILHVPEQNEISTILNHITDIDQHLHSLQKFYSQNVSIR